MQLNFAARVERASLELDAEPREVDLLKDLRRTLAEDAEARAAR